MPPPKFILFGSLLLMWACQVHASSCKIPVVEMEYCPNSITGEDLAYCCPGDIPRCCSLAEYIVSNPVILIGIGIGAIISLIILCCCCCYCCCKRKDRVTVHYVPFPPQPVVVHGTQPPPQYPGDQYPLVSNLKDNTSTNPSQLSSQPGFDCQPTSNPKL